MLTYYLAVIGWLYLLLTAFVRPLVEWDIPGVGPLIDPDYWPGIAVFPIILLAQVFNGMYAVFMVGIYLEKRTRILAAIAGVAAAVNVGGNLLLVPRYGMWAAAWLTVVSWVLMAGWLYAYIQRIYPIPWEWGRVAHLWLVGGLAYGAGAIGRFFGAQWPGYLLSVLFPLLLIITGLATRGERERLRGWLRRSPGSHQG